MKPKLKPNRHVQVGTEHDLEERSFDIAIECTGNASGFEIARKSLYPRGILVLKSTYAGKLSLDASALVVDELTVVRSRCGPFAPALKLLETGQIDVSSLIEARYSIDEGLKAFEHAKIRGVLKVVIEISSS